MNHHDLCLAVANLKAGATLGITHRPAFDVDLGSAESLIVMDVTDDTSRHISRVGIEVISRVTQSSIIPSLVSPSSDLPSADIYFCSGPSGCQLTSIMAPPGSFKVMWITPSYPAGSLNALREIRSGTWDVVCGTSPNLESIAPPRFIDPSFRPGRSEPINFDVLVYGPGLEGDISSELKAAGLSSRRLLPSDPAETRSALLRSCGVCVFLDDSVTRHDPGQSLGEALMSGTNVITQPGADVPPWCRDVLVVPESMSELVETARSLSYFPHRRKTRKEVSLMAANALDWSRVVDELAVKIEEAPRWPRR